MLSHDHQSKSDPRHLRNRAAQMFANCGRRSEVGFTNSSKLSWPRKNQRFSKTMPRDTKRLPDLLKAPTHKKLSQRLEIMLKQTHVVPSPQQSAPKTSPPLPSSSSLLTSYKSILFFLNVLLFFLPTIFPSPTFSPQAALPPANSIPSSLATTAALWPSRKGSRSFRRSSYETVFLCKGVFWLGAGRV